jgi:hypothetical protein
MAMEVEKYLKKSNQHTRTNFFGIPVIKPGGAVVFRWKRSSFARVDLIEVKRKRNQIVEFPAPG